jgi:malonate decarboxylase beta subunit
MMNTDELLNRYSFSELSARDRARAILDSGSMRELVSPFLRMASPWLSRQGISHQLDDGVVVAKGEFLKQPTLVLAIDAIFQGGSIGEVGGAKIAGALELAADDNRKGIPTRAIILFETGGVRLQEANLGLAAIAEIHAAIVDLRRYQPVIGISAGPVGCYGGMSIAAGLCSYIVMTREARLGLNGPAVIEQEAGILEFDARDKPFIWGLTGGEQRFLSNLIDIYVADDTDQIKVEIAALFARGKPVRNRSDLIPQFLSILAEVDTDSQVSPEAVRSLYKGLAL